MNIIQQIYNTFLYEPILNLLVILYFVLGDNMGFAIIALTLIVRILMFPLSKKQMVATQKQKDLAPEIAKLKKKYKNKQVFSQKQMELYKEHGINPAAGCITMIIPLIVIIPLYRVFMNILNGGGTMISEVNDLLYFDAFKFDLDAVLNTQFLYMDLAQPDPYYILPVLAAATQFFLSKHMMGANKKAEKTAKKTPEKSDDIMAGMQSQMTYMMPIITLIIGIRLPSGLVLYWFISSLFMLLQYMLMDKSNINHFKRFLEKSGRLTKISDQSSQKQQ